MIYKVIGPYGARVHTAPNVSAPLVAVYAFGQLVDVVNDNIPDATGDSTKRWALTRYGYYVDISYTNAAGQFEIMQDVSDPDGFHAGGLVRLLHDYESPYWGGIPRFAYPNVPRSHGDPETIPGRNGTHVVIGSGLSQIFMIGVKWNAWGEYWRAINRLANPGMTDADFNRAFWNLTANNRAFTNYDRWKIQDIACGGATLRAVTGKVVYSEFMEVYCLDGSKSPPPVPARLEDLDMTTHFWATNEYPTKMADGSWQVGPFPQFPYGTLVPFVSKPIAGSTTIHTPVGPGLFTDFIKIGWLSPVSSIEKPYNP